MSAYVFDAGTSTEIHTHQRTDNLAILITIPFASQTKRWVYRCEQQTVKILHYREYSTKGGIFSDFSAIFGMSEWFYCLFFAAL